jgi:succinyl-CoA synthetase alpha subunit
VSIVFVPPFSAADAIMEAAAEDLGLIVAVTEGIPVLDMVRVKHFLAAAGPAFSAQFPGLISPGRAKAGIMPGSIHRPGRVGLMSRSGTLTYEAALQISESGLGQSTAVGIGGDPLTGLSFADLLGPSDGPGNRGRGPHRRDRGDSRGRGGRGHRRRISQTGLCLYRGRTMPPGRRLGHAGAVIENAAGRAEAKTAILSAAGAILFRALRISEPSLKKNWEINKQGESPWSKPPSPS